MERVSEAQPSSSSAFSHTNPRIPEDTVFYSIFPDFTVSKPLPPPPSLSSSLLSLHLQILDSVSPYLTEDYVWQHEPFNLSLSSNPPTCSCSSQIPHLHGKTRYGANLDDEWFIVFILFEITRRNPNLSVRIHDTDGEFLLIEAAYSLPRWINPENSSNRVFIRRGELHIVPKDRFPRTPSLSDSLGFLVSGESETRAPDSVQFALKKRIDGYPGRARANMHRVRVKVPVSVAWVLKHEPCLISLAVDGFYDRDVESMKSAAKMERFLGGGEGKGKDEMVKVCVQMSRAMYAQLMQQTFQAPRCYPMPPRSDGSDYVEAELGMKIACGFEMMYQKRRQDGLEGRNRTWEAYKESLERNGYFKGLLPGSNEYSRLMENALNYYKSSALFSKTSDIMNAPVRRIDEILALPYSENDFRDLDLPPSDDDAWLYTGEDELNSVILERQKEMEIYESKHRKDRKSKEPQRSDNASNMHLDDFDLGDIAKSMQEFVTKVSSFEGAEVPYNRDTTAVELNVDRFIKDMESVMGNIGRESNARDADFEEGHTSSSDMDFDDSEDESDLAEPLEGEEIGDSFMRSYSDAMNEELTETTLKKSFVHANEQSSNDNKVQGTSNALKEADDEFTPVDVDVNLVKSLLDSFTSQQGLPGPASNLLGLMGLRLPEDASKEK